MSEGFVSLADQKGFDILAGALDAIMKENCQLVILGVGDQKYHELLLKAKQKYPEHIGANLTFDAMLAELIYSGCDLFLMPSRYEPCGLNQMYSLRYGTVPVVRATGGLDDTIEEDTGFKFAEYSGEALLGAVRSAAHAFADQDAWRAMMRRRPV